MRASGSRITPYKFLWLGAFLVVSPVTTRATVIEIAPDGAVTIHDGPATPIHAAASPVATPAGKSRPHIPADLQPAFIEAGAESRLSPDLVAAVAFVESHFSGSAHSAAGASGVMQLMQQTAADFRVDRGDTAQNIRGGAAYLKHLLHQFGNDIPLALAAYNAGPAAVRRFRGVPPYPETQAYVARVLERLATLSDAGEETEQ